MTTRIKILVFGILILIVAGWFVSAPYRENWARMRDRQADMKEKNPAMLASLKEANIKLELVVKENPEDTVSWFELGTNKQNLGDYLGAIKALRKNIELDTVSTTGLNNLGLIYQELGRYEEAESMFRQIIQREPKLADGYIVLAELYEGGKYKSLQDAEIILLEGLEATKGTNQIRPLLLTLARYYERTGQPEKAEQRYKELEQS